MKTDSFITFPMGYMCFDYTKRESMQVFCMEGLSHVPYFKSNTTDSCTADSCVVLHVLYFSKIYWVMTATYVADGLTERDCVTI
jgi:hypothetical protein